MIPPRFFIEKSIHTAHLHDNSIQILSNRVPSKRTGQLWPNIPSNLFWKCHPTLSNFLEWTSALFGISSENKTTSY